MEDSRTLEAFSAREKASFRNSVLIFAIISLLAIAVLAYTTIHVRHEVQKALDATAAAKNAQTEAESARTELEKLKLESQELQKSLRQSREATQFVTQAINYYHQGNFAAAVSSYDQALLLDPKNAYVLNLKGYSLFKQRNLKSAIATLQESVNVEPQYAWGYFDLARAQCAAGEFEEARKSVSSAVNLRRNLVDTMHSDGEFLRLCKPIADAYQ